ncbi:MAG: hypothetical protein KKG09_06820 [Verrucomicrobia bacterium]|nr:hypothetical protein [Verrucomicrobiota bacterium]MBU4247200.1 hypothetical protein [Verrucomicrobiota bacterium]MBU4291371.1 hypothetical protein [Verrucomicrobiota bacterium]MBU4497695.1 hypothetical protein [Verrucomicrobiota bacterium]
MVLKNDETVWAWGVGVSLAGQRVTERYCVLRWMPSRTRRL